MILTTLADAHRYAGIAPGLAAAFYWCRDFHYDTPDGRYEIDGDRVFALVSTYMTAPGAERRYESHRAHLDVQFVARGTERLLHAPALELEVSQPYDAERDIVFYDDPKAGSSILMTAGDLAVLDPGDAHKPGCMAGGRQTVTKVVVKVRI